MRTVFWENDSVRLIDQRLLPERLEVLVLRDVAEVAEAISSMAVRGAPAIGAAAAFGMALAAARSRSAELDGLSDDLDRAARSLEAARPTASNLAWATRRMLAVLRGQLDGVRSARAEMLAEAQAIADEDVAACRRMGELGAALLPQTSTVLHHCNTGALAAVDHGTALGVVRTAHESGKRIRVLVDETRPRLQGARLTAWELVRLGIEHRLIVDGAAAWFMHRGEVDAVLVGADRIAANGDTANKIGTYQLALAARAHDVPLYVVAPSSTVDLGAPDGQAIPIEERPAHEVTHIGESRVAPEGTEAANPAFDVTPAGLITAIVTERAVVRPPFEAGLREAVRGGSSARSNGSRASGLRGARPSTL